LYLRPERRLFISIFVVESGLGALGGSVRGLPAVALEAEAEADAASDGRSRVVGQAGLTDGLLSSGLAAGVHHLSPCLRFI